MEDGGWRMGRAIERGLFLPSSIFYLQSSLFTLFRPARREFVGNTNVVENARNNCIDNFLNCFWVRIKNWVCRKNRCAGKQQQFEVFNVNEVQWSLARDKNQFFLFLQHHVRRAQQNIFA